MEDKDIIKALEKEIHLAEYVDSDYCSNVEISLIKETLNAFNRQKAEIERLETENKLLIKNDGVKPKKWKDSLLNTFLKGGYE